MTTMLSLILAFMLTMGGSPAVSVSPVNSIGPESGVSKDITGKPRLGEFLKIYPVGAKPNAGNPRLVLNLSFQYKKSPLINLNQAFGMNPINFIDPMGALKFKSILKGAGSFVKNVAIGAAVIVGVAVTAPVSLPVAVALGGGALTIGVTNSISNRIADNQTSKQVVMGILPDMTGASALFAGGTGYDIITVEDLNLNEEQRAECIGGGLGQLTVICSAKWGYKKVNSYISPKIQPYTENTFELIDQAFDALNSSQKGVSIVSNPKNGGNSFQANSGNAKWLEDIELGNNYNKAHVFDYPYRELYIEKTKGGYYRLDSYNEISGEIVSRKYTQLGLISEKTAIGYINELANKYPVGAKIAKVRSSGTIAGSELRGDLILEVPLQLHQIPPSVLRAATKKGVIIRDVYGNTYQ
jgi:hypothetical protein